KGKEQAPETIEVNLSEIIDVKGMKAMGNRLSQHQVKKVELLNGIDSGSEAEETDDNNEEDLTDTNDAAIDETIGLPRNPPAQAEKEQPASPPIEPAQSPQDELVESPSKSVQSFPKEIDFEITNPDDIEIDDKGQLGLF